MSTETQNNAPVSEGPVALPQCPFPCGWSGLHKIAVQDAAYLAKVQWPEDEEGVSVPRATAMRSMDYLIQVCRAMLNAAPVAAQPDLTQQTLDDVMAGIPARDAEIAALRKEIETLQSQQANIEAFVACDASAISYLSLGEYRTALLKMLRQAPATKEPGA